MPRCIFAVTVIAITAAACDGFSEDCTEELRTRTTPADTSILVGQAFTPTVHLSTCGGSRVLSDVFTWHSENVSVASVDSQTGRVVGQAGGEVRITATGEKYGFVGLLRVAVTDQSP